MWAVIGAIAQVTERIRVGTGVTCPTTRIHPAIVAQAAATAAAMLPGRFWFGIGSGENLNEHVVGARWPEPAVRQERMAEAVAVIRLLWQGALCSHHGRHFTVENARLYTLPEEPPPIYVATGGTGRATEIAAEIGDGMIGLPPDREMIATFERAGGAGKPRFGQIHVCWAGSQAEARRTALEWWPNALAGHGLAWELPLPSHFEAATEWGTEDAIAEQIVCATDAAPIVEAVSEYTEAGYDHVYLHQVGPRQDAFLDFSERELLPALRGLRAGAGAAGGGG